MSEATVQFVEMVRLAAAGLKAPAQGHQYPMFCDHCGRQTQHSLEIDGDWEIYRCSCGQKKQYRVK